MARRFCCLARISHELRRLHIREAGQCAIVCLCVLTGRRRRCGRISSPLVNIVSNNQLCFLLSFSKRFKILFVVRHNVHEKSGLERFSPQISRKLGGEPVDMAGTFFRQQTCTAGRCYHTLTQYLFSVDRMGWKKIFP